VTGSDAPADNTQQSGPPDESASAAQKRKRAARAGRLPFGSEPLPPAVTNDGQEVLTESPDGGFELGAKYALAGRVRRIRYQSPDGFFVIASLELDDGHALTLKGNLGRIEVKDRLRVAGRWVRSKYGDQLDVERCEPILPVTPEGIARFLATQLDGVGPRLAERIVDHFGEDTIQTLDRAPERMSEVDGIGPRKLERIIETWRDRHAQRTALLFLQSHGVALGMATRIIKHYGNDTALIVRSEPYRLAREVRGVGFLTADRIAQSLGIPHDSPARINAGLAHAMHEAENSTGHCFLTRAQLVDKAHSLLGVETDALRVGIDRLSERGVLVCEPGERDEIVFSKRAWKAEIGVASDAGRLLARSAEELTDKSGEPADAVELVRGIERGLGIELAEQQREAARLALERKLVVVTGGPGTGKTTLVQILVEAGRRLGIDVHLAAPTGRAARRMAEATGQEASTIHRLLEFSFQAGGFQRDADNPLPTGLFVIDEVSMIDIFLMRALLTALPDDVRLVLVGDVDQLPSVGPGTVLRDFIDSHAVPVVRLTEVFRQAEASLIVRNAHRINQGQTPVLPDDPHGETPIEYFAVNAESTTEAEALVVEFVTERLPKAFDLDPLSDIQVLCPMRVRESGADSLNIALQRVLNPDGKVVGRGEGAIRVGDRVMQLRNDYEKDVYNGDVGVVLRWSKKDREAIVKFEGRTVAYTPDAIRDLGLAYACTVHKSQGSEYPAVVIPLLRAHYPMLQRNLVYTALTRARRLAIFVGQPSAMRIAVQNDRPATRNTRLAERLAATRQDI